jgi:MFS family permease
MKYLVGLNAAFGLAGAFIRSFVNGEVIRIALRDDRSKYVGVFSAWSAVVSSIMALVCDALSRHRGQGFVQILGCLAYFLVVFPFLVLPDLQQWSWGLLGFVYFMYGTGRATFEGSLRAVFADFYPREKEGAFSNIVLQSGSVSTFGFVATYWGLRCKRVGPYCVQYRNGMYHDVLVMELAVAITSMVAIFGYLRAASVFECERRLKQKEDVIQSF